MAEISRVALFGKLNSIMYKAIEGGTVMCRLRGNPHVEIAHWLSQLLTTPNTDLECICRHFAIDAPALARDLTKALDALPRGASSISDFSTELESSVERGWVYGSLMFRATSIRGGHWIMGMLKTPSLSRHLVAISGEFRKINAEALSDQFAAIVGSSSEKDAAAQDGSGAPVGVEVGTRDIFLSYRRDESRHLAGRIFDHLERELGADRVFKDVDSIPVGAKDFSKEIRSQLASTKVMLVLVGPQWLTLLDDTGRRRIDGKDDFVRIEVKWGLDNEIPVIPLLFDDAAMPAGSRLPPTLKAFAKCQGMQIRPDPDFRNDMQRLARNCRQRLD